MSCRQVRPRDNFTFTSIISLFALLIFLQNKLKLTTEIMQ